MRYAPGGARNSSWLMESILATERAREETLGGRIAAALHRQETESRKLENQSLLWAWLEDGALLRRLSAPPGAT